MIKELMHTVKSFTVYKQRLKDKVYIASVTDGYGNTYMVKVRLLDDETIGNYIDFLNTLEKGEPVIL